MAIGAEGKWVILMLGQKLNCVGVAVVVVFVVLVVEALGRCPGSGGLDLLAFCSRERVVRSRKRVRNRSNRV